MGIQLTGDPTTTARENVEELFNRGFLRFMIGGHLGSPFEIWVALCCLAVTVTAARKLTQALIKCVTDGPKEVWRRYREYRQGAATRLRTRMVRTTDPEEEVTSTAPPPLVNNRATGEGREDIEMERIYPLLEEILRENVNMINGNLYFKVRFGNV